MHNRLLDASNKEAINALMTVSKRYAGVKRDQLGRFSGLSLDNYFLAADNKNYQLFGTFEDDQLKAIVGAVISTHTPSWVLTKVFSDGTSGFWPKAAVIQLMAHVFDVMESNGLFQYFTCIAAQHEFSHPKIWDTLVSQRKRYDSYVYARVPANAVTPYYIINRDVLTCTRWPVELYIRHHCLRSEYRVPVKLA